jgi:type II secretory pathway pseudopilin PulG
MTTNELVNPQTSGASTPLSTRRHVAVKNRLVTQSGFALPAAIMVMLIVLLLSAAAVAVSVRSSTSTTRDDNVKAALEAAETGLHVATYRLAMIPLEGKQCVKNGAAEGPKEGKYCKDTTEALGNGATFTYWTSEALSESDKCAAEALIIEAGLDQRCVTAEGQVNGVTRRVQARVAAPTAKPLFPIHGIVGLTKLNISGEGAVQGLAGSNGNLEISGGVKLQGGYTLGFPGGKLDKKGGEITCPPCGIRSKEEGPIPGALPEKHVTAATSEDSRITNKEDEQTGEVTWNPAAYELTVSGKSAHIVLGGTKYYFCKLVAKGGGVITVTASAKTEIFIDSSEDTGSPCKSSQKPKIFELSGGSKLENSAGDPSRLLIEVYGKNEVIVSGAGEVTASMLAPESKVTLSGGSALKGALVGNEVIISGGSFAWDERAASLRQEAAGAEAYQRVPSWEECKPTGATALAGC